MRPSLSDLEEVFTSTRTIWHYLSMVFVFFAIPIILLIGGIFEVRDDVVNGIGIILYIFIYLALVGGYAWSMKGIASRAKALFDRAINEEIDLFSEEKEHGYYVYEGKEGNPDISTRVYINKEQFAKLKGMFGITRLEQD